MSIYKKEVMVFTSTNKLSIKLSILSFCLLFIHGCASLDKNECLNANWYDIGYEDGVKGYSTQRLGDHRKACAKHNITPDSALYKSGHAEGVPLYCLPARGFSLASSGKSYPSLCPEKRFPEFKQAFLKGKEVHVLNTEKRILEEEIVRSEEEIQVLSEAIVDNEALIVSPDTTAYQRRLLHRDIKDLELTILDIQERIYVLENDISDIEQSIQKVSF